MNKKDSLLSRAKRLRKNLTDSEDLLWYYLRNRRLSHFKFKRQVPIGRYIIDFVCEHKKLIIEVDGGQHAENKYDEIRTLFLQKLGYRVIRFWNTEVLLQTEAVLEVIMKELGCL